ncbi:MAG TPA: hypothetical protein PK265_00200 [Candidatus Saccharibacteria bacterium]|nr:hypothetical protein [Candidatus Saccharibacteria bacterium]HRQ97734.1 hypothetical protein [Candidatus Saccharibacteria bacterium]
MVIPRIRNRRLSTILLVLGVMISGFLSLVGNDESMAAPVKGFNPGYIISDNVFTNYQSMTVAQIQDFLKSKVPVCDTWGTGGTTTTSRRDFIRSYGYDVPLKCLIDYTENGKTAAQIIYDTAQKYQINPQVFIVLLQKEQGLVTDDWPGPWQYKTAAGYGCPDTAPCDSQYFGLTNQLDWAGKMYRAIMNASPTWYTPYILGNNYIQYNPVKSCGGTTVNIQNRATQALYNYTPYQPNKSALDAGYGLGDSCGAYGNRNFYLYFNDWFGSPVYGNLMRTENNATVYLVAGDNKYPIGSMTILNLYSNALGPVSFTTDEYLNGKTTGRTASSVIKSDTSSTIYFINAGIRLPFSSCTVAAHYALPCGSEITLTQVQVDSFASGPSMTRLYQTTSGLRYYIENGTKREIFDTASMTSAGISGDFNRLLSSGIDYLPEGLPVISNNSVVTNRDDNKSYLYYGGKVALIPSEILKFPPFSSMLSGDTLSGSSIGTIPQNDSINGLVKDSLGKKYIIGNDGKMLIADPSIWPDKFTLLDDSTLNGVKNSSQPINEGFVKAYDNSSIYMILNAKKYPIGGWSDFINLHLDKSSSWANISKTTIDSMDTGAVVYAPGSLIKSSNSATVYVVNALLHKTPLSSFSVSDDYGLGNTKVVDRSSLDSYATDSAIMSNLLSCDSKLFLANLGMIYEINDQAKAMYGISNPAISAWDELGCSNLHKSTKGLSNYAFIKPDGSKTIYYIENGEAHPISSMGKYVDLGGSSDKLLVASPRFMDMISVGSVI